MSILRNIPLRTPAARSALALSIAAVVLCFVPLFGVLGYELALAMAIAASPLAVWIGARADSPLRALTLAEAMLVCPLGIIALNAFRVRNCDPLGGLHFFFLLPGLSVVCGAATGFVLGRRSSRPVAWGCLIVAGSIVWGVVRFYRTPAIFGFDPFVGYFAGTLYDEEIAIPRALYFARAMHLGFALGALAFVSGRILVGAPLVLSALVLFLYRGPLAMAPDSTDIARALGKTTESQHITLVHSPSLKGAELDELIRDHEFRYAQLARTTGAEPKGGHITSFYFPSADEKRRWMGAGRTFIAKPWRREVYLQSEAFPHPVLKHELAHVFAGSFGDPIFHISVHYWPFRVSVGLIEGIAVALDWHGGRELSATATARALYELEMAPPLASIFGVGFLGYSGPRAYTIAGAFCRFLYETRGIEPLKALFRSAGDFQGVYGQSLSALETEWKSSLLAVPLPNEARELLREAMRQPAVWHKVCAHRLAELRAKAGQAEGAGDYDAAARCLDQVLRDDPDEPQNLVDLAELKLRGRDLDSALGLVGRSLAHPKASAALRAHLEDLSGDLEWRLGRTAEARGRWARLSGRPLDEGTARTVEVKLLMASDRRLEAPLSQLFFGGLPGDGAPSKRRTKRQGRDPSLDLHFAEAADRAAPELGVPRYLVGRGLFLRGAYTEALEPLEQARRRGLATRFDREAIRLIGIAAYHAQKDDLSEEAWNELAARKDAPDGVRLEALDWLERVKWERRAALPTKAERSQGAASP